MHEGSIPECPVHDSDIVFRGLLSVLTRDAADEIKQHEKDILGVVRVLGDCSSQYQRERGKSMRAIVSEIYSPPRVTAATKLQREIKIILGFALDLTTADTDDRLWGFSTRPR